MFSVCLSTGGPRTMDLGVDPPTRPGTGQGACPTQPCPPLPAPNPHCTWTEQGRPPPPPDLGLDRGHPQLDMALDRGYPPRPGTRLGTGHPPPNLAKYSGGYPLSSAKSRGYIPPLEQLEWYGVGSTPLAVTQEVFLVTNNFKEEYAGEEAF